MRLSLVVIFIYLIGSGDTYHEEFYKIGRKGLKMLPISDLMFDKGIQLSTWTPR